MDRALLKHSPGIMRKLAVIGLFATIVVAAFGGCVTPSIPIPPPDPAKMTFTFSVTDGLSNVVFSYPQEQNYAGGVVYLFNHNTGMGVFQNVNADDSIGPTQPLHADVGNQVVISIENVEQTVSRCIVLRDGPQDPNAYCSF